VPHKYIDLHAQKILRLRYDTIILKYRDKNRNYDNRNSTKTRNDEKWHHV